MFIASASASAPRWREVVANGTWPAPRFSHTATMDGRRMLVFGGNSFDAVDELFAYDVRRREWRRLKPTGAPPSRRYGHQAVVTADGRMVVIGGYKGSFLNDVHEIALPAAADDGCRREGARESSWRRVARSCCNLASPSAR